MPGCKFATLGQLKYLQNKGQYTVLVSFLAFLPDRKAQNSVHTHFPQKCIEWGKKEK